MYRFSKLQVLLKLLPTILPEQTKILFPMVETGQHWVGLPTLEKLLAIFTNLRLQVLFAALCGQVEECFPLTNMLKSRYRTALLTVTPTTMQWFVAPRVS